MNSVGSTEAKSGSNDSWKLIAIGTGIVFLLAFGIRIANFSHDPITDELYHLLAAESWATDGSFAIAEGEYRRGAAFTAAVGVVHSLTDGNVDAIRIFCIVLGSLLVAAVYAWTRKYVGRVEAAIASVLLILLPGAIFLAQHIRFYSLHALIFFLLAGGIYVVVTTTMSTLQRIFFIALIALLALLGLHLQVTTLVGLAGVFSWVVLYKHREITDWFGADRRRAIAAAVVAIGFVAVMIIGRSFIRDLIEIYQSSAMWNSGDSPMFYYGFYKRQFGTFWSLAPAAIVIALLVRPRPALFCTCVFVVAFVIQSFGGMRAERFLFYALPYFYVIWGIALVAAGKAIADLIGGRLSGLRATQHSEWITHVLPVAVLAAIGGFLLLTTPSVAISAKMALGRPAGSAGATIYWDRYQTKWGRASDYLQELHSATQVTIVSQALHALYYIGDYDYALNATELADVRSLGVKDDVDPRTGRPVIDNPESLGSLVNCHESGVVIIHAPAWRNNSRVNAATADYIQNNMTEVDASKKWGLRIFKWRTPGADSACPSK